MSTAGKVLVVVVTLAIVVWVVLFAKVADLNANWGQHIAKLEGDVIKLDKQLYDLRAEVNRLVPETTVQQIRRDKQLAVLRSSISDIEKLDVETREALTRIELQVASVQSAVQGAQAQLALRNQEKADTQKNLATAKAEVETIKGQNAQLLDELTKDREQFVKLREENTKLRERLATAPPSGPRTRNATLITPGATR